MKRKIALALAAVVAISMIVPMNAFAASNNYQSGSPITNYANGGAGSQFIDPGKILPAGSSLTASVPLKSGDATASGVLANNSQGTAITVAINAGGIVSTQPRSFQVTLTNAEWSFYTQSGLINQGGTNPATISSPLSDNTYGQELVPTSNNYIQSLQPLGSAGTQVSSNVNYVPTQKTQQTNLVSDSVLNNTALDVRALFNMNQAYGANSWNSNAAAYVKGSAFTDGYDYIDAPALATGVTGLGGISGLNLKKGFISTTATDSAYVLSISLTVPGMAVTGAGTAANLYTGTDLYNIISANYYANENAASLNTGDPATDVLAYYYLALYQMAQLSQTSSTMGTLPMTAADMLVYMGEFGANAALAATLANDAGIIAHVTVAGVTTDSVPYRDMNAYNAAIAANPLPAGATVTFTYGTPAQFAADIMTVNGNLTVANGGTATTVFTSALPVIDTTGIINAPTAEQTFYQNYSSSLWNYSSFVSQVGGVANNLGTGTNYSALPYSISITGNSTAVVTFYGNSIANQSAVVIPFCAISTGTGAITAAIVSNTSEVSPTVTPINLSTAGTAGCIMTLDQSNTVPAQYRIALGNITITEQQLKLLHTGAFYIDAPVGYHFVNDGVTSTDTNGTQTSYDLTGASRPNSGTNALSYPFSVSVNPELYLNGPVTMLGNAYAWRGYNGSSYDPGTSGVMSGMADPTVGGPNNYQYYPSSENSRMYVNLTNVVTNGTVFGSIVIGGLIVAQDNPANTAYGQTLTMNINDASISNALILGQGIGVGSNGGAGVNTVSFTQRQQFAINYNLVNATPVNAYSGWRNMGDIEPWSVNLAQLSTNPDGVSTPITVLFQEQTPNSWFSNQDTTFTLTDSTGAALTNVKFSTVDIVTNNITNGIGSWGASSPYQPWSNNPSVYDQRYNVNSTNNVMFNSANNSIDLFDLTKALNSNGIAKLGAIQMQFRLSAAPGFTGDVYLTVANQALTTSLINQTSVKIATFHSPITVSTTTTVAQIGYQNYNVADVSFTEDIPGLIQSSAYNNTINMYLGEYGNGLQTRYMYFAPVTSSNITVTPANNGLTVSNLGIGNANQTADGYLTNSVSFTVGGGSYHQSSSTDTATTYTPSTITISNLIVNIDRTVPQGDYQIIIGGNAVTDNCPIPAQSSTPNAAGICNPNGTPMDFFNTMGYVAPTNYITIGTSGSNLPYTQRVAVTAGSDTALVGPADNQTSFSMGCQAFIDPNTNRMMVPIRFAVAALGVDPSQVLWDANSHTCTVYTAEKMLTFVQGQSTMYVNNQPFTLQNDDGTYVMPNLYPASDGTYRLFIPFRALADAIGINVTWDGSTSTAVFNPTPDEWTAYQAAVAAATPAPTATPAATATASAAS